MTRVHEVSLAFVLVRPWALWGLVAVVPIVMLHHYRRRRIVVPFLPLLLEGRGRAPPLGGWRRIRDLASLVARVLALGAVLLALGGLRPREEGPREEALVLVLDADLTTGAREADGRVRLAHGLDLAEAVVKSRRWSEVAVLVAADVTEVLVAPTKDRSVAVEGMRHNRAALRPSAGTADLAAALRTAAQTLSGEDVRVVAITARELDPASVPLPAPILARLDLLGAGRTSADQGFVDLALTESPESPRVGVRVAVRNDDVTPRTRRVVARHAGAEVGAEDVTLAPGEQRDVAFDVLPDAEGGFLRIALEGDPDAFAANDRVSVWLAPPHRPSVLVVRGAAMRPYTRAVLEALGERIDAGRSGEVAAADLASAPPRDVTLVDGVDLPAGALRPGSWLFLAPLGGDLPFRAGAPVREPLVWRVAPGHPLVRDADLSTAFVARGFPIEGEGVHGLAFAEGRTLVAEGVAGDGPRETRWVAFGLDPEGSDLPVRAAYPLLVRNAILALARAPRAPFKAFYRPGEPLRPTAPLGGSGVARVRWEGGEARDVPISPQGETWRVPAGARGEAEVVAGAATAGRTAFVDLDPARRVAPAREPAPTPGAVEDAPDPEKAWRLLLVALAGALLLFDLLLLLPRRLDHVGGER